MSSPPVEWLMEILEKVLSKQSILII